MEKVWSYKSPDTLSDNEKNRIIEKVFDIVLDNKIYEDIGKELVNYVTSKGYVFQEEIED